MVKTFRTELGEQTTGEKCPVKKTKMIIMIINESDVCGQDLNHNAQLEIQERQGIPMP